MRDSDGSDAPPLHQARARPGDAALGRALALVRYLRERCPWDARQDPRSLRPYLLEEAHEVAEAIQAGDDGALPEELGDLLLNVAFQVVLAEERDAFGAPEVVERLEGKMAARHPHIYGDAEEPPDWERLKSRERSSEAADPFAGVPRGLEPLSRALRLQDRAAALGFDWPHPRGAVEKLREEADELLATVGAGDAARIEEEIGDLLFAAVNAARLLDVHPSNALLAASAKFRRRFRTVRRLARERGLTWEEATLEELDVLWETAKEREGDGEAEG